MTRLNKLQISFFLLTIFFFINSSSISAAGDSCFQGFSTIPGSVKYAFKWAPDNPDEIARNSDVEIKVIGGIQPYIWSVSGNGFSLSQSQTTGLSNTLNADGTACGAATITVTDNDGSSVAGYVRCTVGKWVLIENITCGTLDCCGGTCHSEFYCIQGKYRYMDSWVAGNLMGTRWHPTGNCEKYSCTPYTSDHCYDPGYYPPMYHVGIHYKKKWEWGCP
jgi:hypothetical protein